VGITPLLSIHDHFTDCYPDGRMAFIVSAKSPKHIYRYELLTGRFQAHFTGGGPRLGRDDLQSRLGGLLTDPRANARICGPPGFIDVMVDTLIELGFSELRIRSEAFV
jgi:ferredoxin-NADP reductase